MARLELTIGLTNNANLGPREHLKRAVVGAVLKVCDVIFSARTAYRSTGVPENPAERNTMNTPPDELLHRFDPPAEPK